MYILRGILFFHPISKLSSSSSSSSMRRSSIDMGHKLGGGGAGVGAVVCGVWCVVCGMVVCGKEPLFIQKERFYIISPQGVCVCLCRVSVQEFILYLYFVLYCNKVQSTKYAKYKVCLPRSGCRIEGGLHIWPSAY